MCYSTADTVCFILYLIHRAKLFFPDNCWRRTEIKRVFGAPGDFPAVSGKRVGARMNSGIQAISSSSSTKVLTFYNSTAVSALLGILCSFPFCEPSLPPPPQPPSPSTPLESVEICRVRGYNSSEILQILFFQPCCNNPLTSISRSKVYHCCNMIFKYIYVFTYNSAA